jgi:hypothetical protein
VVAGKLQLLINRHFRSRQIQKFIHLHGATSCSSLLWILDNGCEEIDLIEKKQLRAPLNPHPGFRHSL